MKTNLIARAEIEINSTVEKVWDALTNPEKIKEYFFGTYVVTDWKVDSQVLWQGEWNGKSYEDKGKVLKFEENKVIAYSHFSPLTGLPDIPENYHTIEIEIFPGGSETKVVLTQDGNKNENEKGHSEENWKMVLEGLKNFVEGD